MAYEFRCPTKEELRLYYEVRVLPEMTEVHGLFVNDELRGTIGIMKDPDYGGSLIDDEARMLGFMDVRDVPKVLGMDVARHMRYELDKRGGALYVQHDDSFPTAEKFLRVLGFKPTAEKRKDLQNTGRYLRLWRREGGPLKRASGE